MGLKSRFGGAFIGHSPACGPLMLSLVGWDTALVGPPVPWANPELPDHQLAGWGLLRVGGVVSKLNFPQGPLPLWGGLCVEPVPHEVPSRNLQTVSQLGTHPGFLSHWQGCPHFCLTKGGGEQEGKGTTVRWCHQLLLAWASLSAKCQKKGSIPWIRAAPSAAGNGPRSSHGDVPC